MLIIASLRVRDAQRRSRRRRPRAGGEIEHGEVAAAADLHALRHFVGHCRRSDTAWRRAVDAATSNSVEAAYLSRGTSGEGGCAECRTTARSFAGKIGIPGNSVMVCRRQRPQIIQYWIVGARGGLVTAPSGVGGGGRRLIALTNEHQTRFTIMQFVSVEVYTCFVRSSLNAWVQRALVRGFIRFSFFCQSR